MKSPLKRKMKTYKTKIKMLSNGICFSGLHSKLNRTFLDKRLYPEGDLFGAGRYRKTV